MVLKDAGELLSLDLPKDGAIVIRGSRRKYSLEELVAGITPKNRHGEIDWGRRPCGKEIW